MTWYLFASPSLLPYRIFSIFLSCRITVRTWMSTQQTMWSEALPGKQWSVSSVRQPCATPGFRSVPQHRWPPRVQEQEYSPVALRSAISASVVVNFDGASECN